MVTTVPGAARPPDIVSMPSLARLAALAREAGAITLRYYHDGVAVEQKGAQGPVTEADRAAHRHIADALRSWDATIPVISEEGSIPEYAVRRHWTRFWLVDPLDGTKEFIQRSGDFTVNIALIDRGEPVLGVVLAPALDQLYSAAKGLGAWRSVRGGAAERIHTRPPLPDEPRIVVESRSHPSAALEAYLRGINVGRRVQVGSSLKFCWVADGTAHLYPRLGPTMEWDVAAGDCVFRNAARTGQNPSPLTYNKPDLRNEHFVIGM